MCSGTCGVHAWCTVIYTKGSRTKTIVTRFTDRCVNCDGYIGGGETVYWEPNVGVWHIDEAGCHAASDPELEAGLDWGDQ